MITFKQYLEESDRQETIDKLKAHLDSGATAHITFQKADGSETTRHATLNPEHINQGGGDGNDLRQRPQCRSTVSMITAGERLTMIDWSTGDHILVQ